MLQNTRWRTFLSFLFFCVGAYLDWNFHVFSPYQAVYPPASPYRVSGKGPAGTKLVTVFPGLHYKRSPIGEFFLGKHYRFLWASEVQVPLLDLQELGLQVKKVGGGMQTTSFTLLDNQGEEYMLRSVDKNPIGVLPGFWLNTFALGFVRDQISATDPFALPAIGTLANAAGILQAPAKAYYVSPDNAAIRKFRQTQGLFMLYPKRLDVAAYETNGAKLEAVFPSEALDSLLHAKAGYTLDSVLFLRCRLFDLLISDWDRHPGQWDWLAFSNGKHTVLRPAPKDRDQALGLYEDGLFPWILSRNFGVRKITSFTAEYEDIEGFMQNGFVLDSAYLKNFSEADFIKEAHRLQALLPDKVVAEAFAQYPQEVSNAIVPRHTKTLGVRRQKLDQAAREFYRILQQKMLRK